MILPMTCPCGENFTIDTAWFPWQAQCPACHALLQVKMPEAAGVSSESETVPEVDVEVLDKGEVEGAEDENEVYVYVPEHANLPDAPPGTVALGHNFFGTLGLIRLKAPASCLAYGAGHHWALAGQENDVQILDMKGSTKTTRFCSHESKVTCVALSADGRFALSGDEDGDLLYWELATQKLAYRLRGHDGAVHSVTILPTGAYALSGGEDGVTRLWELSFGKECHLAESDLEQEVTAVSASRDSRLILAGGSKGRVQLWEVQSGACLQDYPDVDREIVYVRLGEDGRTVMALARPPSFRILSHPQVWSWDAETTKPQRCFDKPASPRLIPYCAALDQTGKRLLIAGRYPLGNLTYGRAKYGLEVWSLTTGFCQYAFKEVQGDIACLAVSSDNARILAALANRKVQVFAMLP